MVGAKQSRFVEEVGSKDQDVQEFHRTFCATQQIAARIAKTEEEGKQHEVLECPFYVYTTVNWARSAF